jgi:hypothetical protein
VISGGHLGFQNFPEKSEEKYFPKKTKENFFFQLESMDKHVNNKKTTIIFIISTLFFNGKNNKNH